MGGSINHVKIVKSKYCAICQFNLLGDLRLFATFLKGKKNAPGKGIFESGTHTAGKGNFRKNSLLGDVHIHLCVVGFIHKVIFSACNGFNSKIVRSY